MAKKRIALVVNSLSNGGAERAVSNLSLHLSEQYDIDLIVNDLEHLDYPYRGHIISLGLAAGQNRMGTGYQILALVRRTVCLRKLRKTQKYEAVLSFSEMTNLANVLSRGETGKTIISCHTSPNKSSGGGWKYRAITKYIIPFCFRRADWTVSCSKEISDELISDHHLPRSKSKVIYNGVDIIKILSQAEETIPEEDNFLKKIGEEHILLTVGRLVRQKGQTHLIRAVKKLRSEGLNVKLLILGEGEQRAELEDLVEFLGLKDAVFLPGFVKNPFFYMARADAVVFPSLYEGFSYAIAETLACHAPCISTDHTSGAREILAPDSNYKEKVTDRSEKTAFGILVPVCRDQRERIREECSKEERILADAIRELITDAELMNFYRNAAARRAKQLSIQAVCRQWSDLIEGR